MASSFVSDRTHPPPDWFDVESSNVQAIRYVFWEEALEVKFKAKGKNPRERTWRYPNVSADVFWDMLESASKGKFVWARLRSLPGAHEV